MKDCRIKLAQPFLITSQSASFGTHFRDYGQYSTYACINTLLTTILIPLSRTMLVVHNRDRPEVLGKPLIERTQTMP